MLHKGSKDLVFAGAKLAMKEMQLNLFKSSRMSAHQLALGGMHTFPDSTPLSVLLNTERL